MTPRRYRLEYVSSSSHLFKGFQACFAFFLSLILLLHQQWLPLFTLNKSIMVSGLRHLIGCNRGKANCRYKRLCVFCKCSCHRWKRSAWIVVSPTRVKSSNFYSTAHWSVYYPCRIPSWFENINRTPGPWCGFVRTRGVLFISGKLTTIACCRSPHEWLVFFFLARNVDPPIWYDTDVKLFEIQRL